MRDSLIIRFFVCPLLIFWILTFTPSNAITQRELTIEDCQEWVEEKSDIPNQVAHVEKRIFNYVFDGLIFFLFRATCLLPFQGITHNNWLYILAITIFLWLLYYPIMEYKTGKTIAKFITQTHVVNIDSTRIETDQALGRNLLRLIPFEVFSFFKTYPIGWHDSFSNSKVVNDPHTQNAIEWVDEIPADFGL